MNACRFVRNIAILFVSLAVLFALVSRYWPVPELILWRTSLIGGVAFSLWVLCLVYQTVKHVLEHEDEGDAEAPTPSNPWLSDPVVLGTVLLLLLGGIFVYRSMQSKEATELATGEAALQEETVLDLPMATGTLSILELHTGTTTFTHPDLKVTLDYPKGYLRTATKTHLTLMPFASIPDPKVRESANAMSLDMWLTRMPDLNASLGDMDAAKQNDRLVVINGRTCRAFELVSKNTRQQPVAMTLCVSPKGIVAFSFMQGSPYEDDYRSIIKTVVIPKDKEESR